MYLISIKGDDGFSYGYNLENMTDYQYFEGSEFAKPSLNICFYNNSETIKGEQAKKLYERIKNLSTFEIE